MSVEHLRRVHGVPLDRLRLPWDVYGTSLGAQEVLLDHLNLPYRCLGSFWGDLAPQALLGACWDRDGCSSDTPAIKNYVFGAHPRIPAIVSLNPLHDLPCTHAGDQDDVSSK